MTMAMKTTSAPNSSWLAAGLLALLAFGACWTGAIVWWRSRTGDPGTGELMFYLFVLPGGLLCGALAAQKRLAAAPPAPTPAPDDAPPPLPETLPVAILAAAIRSPYGATLDDLADSLARNKARPALDAELTDEEGFPLLTARCSDAVDPGLQAEITAWLGDAVNNFSDEQWRALVLASSVTAELATALPLHQEHDNLRLAPVLSADWPAAQRDAAGRWLQHIVVQHGWPAEHITIVPPNEADLSDTVPTTLLRPMATAAPGITLIVAGASHVGDATVQAWTIQQMLCTSTCPHGQIPGEGAVGLLLTNPALGASTGIHFTVLEPIATAMHAISADEHRGPLPPVLPDLARATLTTAAIDASTLAAIVADTRRTTRMLELMSFANSAAPQLTDAGEIVAFGRASGTCGAVPAITALALASHYVCDRNGPVLWLSNEDAFQRCAAIVRPPDMT